MASDATLHVARELKRAMDRESGDLLRWLVPDRLDRAAHAGFFRGACSAALDDRSDRCGEDQRVRVVARGRQLVPVLELQLLGRTLIVSARYRFDASSGRVVVKVDASGDRCEGKRGQGQVEKEVTSLGLLHACRFSKLRARLAPSGSSRTCSDPDAQSTGCAPHVPGRHRTADQVARQPVQPFVALGTRRSRPCVIV